MVQYKLGEVESAFANLIWDNEPLPSSKLVELCAQKLDWKKSTTYTVLRRLCERGIFQNEGGTVTALISREDFENVQRILADALVRRPNLFHNSLRHSEQTDTTVIRLGLREEKRFCRIVQARGGQTVFGNGAQGGSFCEMRFRKRRKKVSYRDRDNTSLQHYTID